MTRTLAFVLLGATLAVLPMGAGAQRSGTADTARRARARGVASAPSSLDRLRLIFRTPRRGTTRVNGASRGALPGVLPGAFALLPPQPRGHFVAQFSRELVALPVCVTQDSARIRIEVGFDLFSLVDTTLARGIHLVPIPPSVAAEDLPLVLWRVRVGDGNWQQRNVAERAELRSTDALSSDSVTAGLLRRLLGAGLWYDAVRIAVTSATDRSSGADQWLAAVNALAKPPCPNAGDIGNVRH